MPNITTNHAIACTNTGYPLSFVHMYPHKPTHLKIVYCLLFKVQVYCFAIIYTT